MSFLDCGFIVVLPDGSLHRTYDLATRRSGHPAERAKARVIGQTAKIYGEAKLAVAAARNVGAAAHLALLGPKVWPDVPEEAIGDVPVDANGWALTPCCDICNRVAAWQHPAGGYRCTTCPRPAVQGSDSTT